MKKQILKAVSNHDEYVCYKLEKSEGYYEFLYELLKEFDIDIPDLEEADGSEPQINNYVDSFSFYGGEKMRIWDIKGYNHVFLIIQTELRDKLSEFMLENTEMVDVKN